MEQYDYRSRRHPNVFFGPVKRYFGLTIPMLWFNTAVMVCTSGLMFLILLLVLRRQIRLTR